MVFGIRYGLHDEDMPNFKPPTWLYTQLQRLDFKAIRNVKKENNEITGDKGKELDNEQTTNLSNNI